MNIDYLFSIAKLYLQQEDNAKKTNLKIEKKQDQITFSFNMKFGDTEKTSFNLPLEIVNQYFPSFLSLYKGDLLIIDEKYEYHQNEKTCYYYVLFKNGRIVSFDGFSVIEINYLRNYLYKINLYQDEIRVNIEDKKVDYYKPKYNFQYAGYSSLKNIILLVIVFLSILVISLLTCNLLIK